MLIKTKTISGYKAIIYLHGFYRSPPEFLIFPCLLVEKLQELVGCYSVVV